MGRWRQRVIGLFTHSATDRTRLSVRPYPEPTAELHAGPRRGGDCRAHLRSRLQAGQPAERSRMVKKMLSYSGSPGYRRTKPARRTDLAGFTGIIDTILESGLSLAASQYTNPAKGLGVYFAWRIAFFYGVVIPPFFCCLFGGDLQFRGFSRKIPAQAADFPHVGDFDCMPGLGGWAW